MLRPVDNHYRESKLLNGLWRFCLDNHTELTSRPWTSTLPGHTDCPVPASYNDIFVPAIRRHVGKVWYQREITIPRAFDQRVVLRLDSATHAGEVYCNNTFITKHVGGYMPFEADLSKHVQPGDVVRITIGVSNVLTNETIPPGRVSTNELGQKELEWWHDFYNYAGLARSIRLCSIPKTYVSDVTVKTDIDESTGIVHYNVEVQGDGNVEVELADEKNKVVGTVKGHKGSIKVDDATFWAPLKAYLYKFTVRVVDHAPVDEYSLNIGIRTVKVEGYEILVNDEPVYLKGFGRHEDTPVKGKGHDDAWMVHDFELMKWTGANSFRTSHYPYAEEIYDYADRQGFLIIDECPAVGLNLSIKAGLSGAARLPTFTPDFANDNTQAAHKDAVREMITRDKNHPSVIMWSITNEPDSGDKGARAFFEPTVKLAREMDDRPLIFASVQFVSSDKDVIADLFDVIGLNRYYGWYTETGNLEKAEKKLEYELLAWQHRFERPIIITEYGADTIQGLRSVDHLPWSEDYQVSLYEMYHQVFDRIPSVHGEQVWNFADFSTDVGIIRVDGNKKGIFSRDRKPKQAAYTLKERWTKKHKK